MITIKHAVLAITAVLVMSTAVQAAYSGPMHTIQPVHPIHK